MEQPYLSSQLEYLEQKFQESQRTIAQLQQRIEGQTYELQEQTQRIQILEEQLGLATAQAVRINQLDQQMEKFREEMLQAIERRFQRHEPVSAAAEFIDGNLVRQRLDHQAKSLNEIQRELQKNSRYDEIISLTRAETGRLHKEISEFQSSLDALRLKVDERVKPMRYLEERQNVDTRTLAEVQTELPNLHKKIDTGLAKIQLVEQRIPQFAKYELALDGVRDEMRRYREHIDFQVAQRERQLKDWTGLAQMTERQLKENEKAMEKYTEHYQLNKRALASLHDFQERLQNDQHRITELQRLAEERQRAEWEKFQTEFEQRWQKQSMEMQPHFTDFQRNIEAIQKRIEEVAKWHQTVDEQMNLILQIIEEDVQNRVMAVANWQQRFEKIASGEG
jgi:hypothetical protein